MTAVVVISRTRGRTPTRGKSNARPLSSGMEISIFPKHGALARNGLRKIAGYQLLRVRAGDRGLRSLLGPAIQFLPATAFKFSPAIQVAGHLYSGLPRFKPLQKSLRCLADSLQLLSFPNAPELHPQLGRRRLECPTKVLKDLTK